MNPTLASTPPFATLLVTGLGFVAGTAWQLQQAKLQPGSWVLVALVLAAGVALWAAWRLRRGAMLAPAPVGLGGPRSCWHLPWLRL